MVSLCNRHAAINAELIVRSIQTYKNNEIEN